MSQHRKRKRAWRALFPTDDPSLMKELKDIAWRMSKEHEDNAKDLLQEALRVLWMHGAKVVRFDRPRQAALYVAQMAMWKHMQRFVLRRYGIVHFGERNTLVDRVDWEKWARRMEAAAPDVVLRELAKSADVQIHRSLIERTLQQQILGDGLRRAA